MVLRRFGMSNENQRKLRRVEVHQNIDVFNLISGLSVGRLVNIHREGLMIIGDSDMKADSLYQLSLRLPEPIEGQKEILLGVDCLWVRASEDQHQHWTGFHIIDISAQGLALIDSLV